LERSLQELRGGAVPPHTRLKAPCARAAGRAPWLALALGWLLAAPAARAELGHDLERVQHAIGRDARAESLRLRLMERGEVTPIVLPPWALDPQQGDCTTLVLLSPAPTQFVVHVHPWQGLPSTFVSRAGALQLTRCGKARISLLSVLVEMRSPRAVVYPLVAVGANEPEPLVQALPERETGPDAPLGDPGPTPAREPLDVRLRRFEDAAQNAGASGTETARLPSQGYVRLLLEPGCHRLLASGPDGAPPSALLLSENDSDKAERVPASSNGDVRHELCTARARRLLVSVEESAVDIERKLAVAHFPLPSGLPGRVGPEVAERLLGALGQSAAPRRLGTLVASTLGAQGRTPLPRELLPRTCYLAAALVVHGSAQGLSLGVEAGASNAVATAAEGTGAQLGFCTGQTGHAALEVEARGLGLSWLFLLFQMGPARAETP
jgi:hypothetical protein